MQKYNKKNSKPTVESILKNFKIDSTKHYNNTNNFFTRQWEWEQCCYYPVE